MLAGVSKDLGLKFEITHCCFRGELDCKLWWCPALGKFWIQLSCCHSQ